MTENDITVSVALYNQSNKQTQPSEFLPIYINDFNKQYECSKKKYPE